MTDNAIDSTLRMQRVSRRSTFEASLIAWLPRFFAFAQRPHCPICNTHNVEFRKRAREIEAAGIKEVIVFHSSPKSIRSYQRDVPVLMVGHPKKFFYKQFGVETSLGFAPPNALGAAMRGIVHRHFGLQLAGGPLGLPADFLIAPSGRIYAVKYGAHAYDQWSVDELCGRA